MTGYVSAPGHRLQKAQSGERIMSPFDFAQGDGFAFCGQRDVCESGRALRQGSPENQDRLSPTKAHECLNAPLTDTKLSFPTLSPYQIKCFYVQDSLADVFQTTGSYSKNLEQQHVFFERIGPYASPPPIIYGFPVSCYFYF